MAAPHIFPDLEATKRVLREPVLATAPATAQRTAAATGLAAHVLQACPPPPGAVVAGVWPFGDEFDLRPLMHALHARGHPIVLPMTPPRGQPLTFARWRPGDALIRERFGTLAPAGAPDGPPDGEEMVPDFLLMPLLAFDRRLHRLGYDAGTTTVRWQRCGRCPL